MNDRQTEKKTIHFHQKFSFLSSKAAEKKDISLKALRIHLPTDKVIYKLA